MRFGPLFKIRERLVEAQGEARNDFLILAELAQRLGYGDLYPQSEEDMLRFALEPSGFTLEEVRAAGGEARVPTVMMQYKKWEKGLLRRDGQPGFNLSLIHISEPTRLGMISYAVFCLKKKKKRKI